MNKGRVSEKAQNERNAAMSLSIGDIFSFYRKLSTLTRGSVYRQYTKRGPGRYHQNASRAELKSRREMKK